MSNKIDIPVQDLSRIFDEIKILKNEIDASRIEYIKAFQILSSESNNYVGGCSGFLDTTNASMAERLNALSEYYQSSYVYILNVMNTFIGVDEEITRKLYNEFKELKLIE
ncbi:MAG: hypothetical protein ACRC7N_07440 [Clostridium sp.]